MHTCPLTTRFLPRSQVGIPFTLLESAPSLTEGGTSISLWKNAFRALEALGVAAELRDQYPINIDTYANLHRLIPRGHTHMLPQC